MIRKFGRSLLKHAPGAAGTLAGAMAGECAGLKRGDCGRVDRSLRIYIRDPLLTENLNGKALKLLVRECLYRIRALEGRDRPSESPKS